MFCKPLNGKYEIHEAVKLLVENNITGLTVVDDDIKKQVTVPE